MDWRTPAGERLSLEGVIQTIFEYITGEPDYIYKLYIGSDSQVGKKATNYASVIAIHRKGKGGRYFITTEKTSQRDNIHTRLIREAQLSIEVVQLLVESGIEGLISPDDTEIHLDIGPNGKSREVISACVGWCEGMGINWQIKPDAAVATHVADRHVR